MKVIIAGTRHGVDRGIVREAIEESGFDVTELLTGKCPTGVDPAGERWAREHLIPVREFPADWSKHGKRAGPLRNAEMAQEGEALIALPCAHSRGTRDMIKRAKGHGLVVFEREVKCSIGVRTGRWPVPKP